MSAANEPAGAEKVTASPSNSVTSNNDSGIGDGGVSPRDQLNYLAQLIGFQVRILSRFKFLTNFSTNSFPGKLQRLPERQPWRVLDFSNVNNGSTPYVTWSRQQFRRISRSGCSEGSQHNQ